MTGFETEFFGNSDIAHLNLILVTNLANCYEKLIVNRNLLDVYQILALMETASFCGGVRHKRYSVQQD
jgi:hypothetical protein